MKISTILIFISCLLILIVNTVLPQKVTTVFPEIPPYVLETARIDFDDGQDPMDSRLFHTTTIRMQISLRGFWDFVTDPERTGELNNYFAQFPEPETQLWVPGTWNATARYWQYQGAAWLQRTFTLPEAGNLHIRFGGVFYQCKVWLDGKFIGEHEGGYCPFSYTIPDVKKGRHIITVCADNGLNDESLPKHGVDWFPYGGIYRPVYVEIVPDIYIDKFHVIPRTISSERAELLVKVFVKNIKKKSVKKKIWLEINGNLLYNDSHQIDSNTPVVEFITIIKNPKLWSPDKPNLYSARVIIGDNEDDQFDRFGVRSLKTEGYKILLNGKRIKLMGANHHDDHPDWGSALPPRIIFHDIEILKRMGTNALRCHYPTSELFMDFCDQNGLLFMSEVPSWQYRPEQLAKDVIKNKIRQQYFDMVYRDMNHPSIFSWSLGNEWREFQKSYDDIKELIDYARTVDTTHFITFITGGAHVDRSYQLVDIICTNWAQYQWYWDPSFSDEDSRDRVTSTVLSEDVAKKSIAELNKIFEQFPDKPVILTEFGGSGSQAGWHSWGNVKWSEEYQARNVWDSGSYALETDWISGGCVWQFCDTRTAHIRMLGPRLRGWNVKGVVDCYRQPKMAFYKLQELFHLYLAK